MKQLSTTNDKVSFKNRTLLIHIFLMLCSCLAAVYIQQKPNKTLDYSSISKILMITSATLDLIVQFFICYICVKFGANDSLNRFDCCLVDDGNGGYQIKFILRQSVPEAIGVPHAANEVDDEEVMY
jgi:hypothetical protein